MRTPGERPGDRDLEVDFGPNGTAPPAFAHRAVSLAELLRVRRPVDRGLADPDPTVRLEFWHQLAREPISVELCMRLAAIGMPALAAELMRQRGDIP